MDGARRFITLKRKGLLVRIHTTVLRFILACLLTLCAGIGFAHAASLRVCLVDNISIDIATAPVFLNGQPFHPDMLTGSTFNGTPPVGRCNTLPIPATVVRGQDQAVTVKYTNTLGEVSAPSNALPFRLPSSPPVPVVNGVSIVVP